ncbi:MAG TPA: Fic family protein [Terriglobales bacterium]|jgi:fido (protein-threonine AMPylation protein)|nr:Fic family protein [Terriglobales bacterium]
MALAPDLVKRTSMVLSWEPMADLPQDWGSLTDGELGPLLQFWNDQRADLEQSGALAEFNKRLGREWSIETGQIEGVYNLDRGLTETLIERGIDSDLIPNQPGQKPPEIIAAIIQDHAEVLEGLFQFVKGNRPISKSYIHELHAALLRHQDTTAVRDQFGNLFEAKLVKGKYKERPNNPKKPDGSMHQYCPPEHVDSEMERLLSLHAEHEKKGVPVEIEAAWLHHRFTRIHPYQDGNGRVARALASLLFIRAGWFPVVVTRDDRPRYIDALEAADEGGLSSIVSFFVHLQRRELSDAMRVAPDTRPIQTVSEAIAAAKRVLHPGRRSDPTIWVNAKDTADRLMEFAANRLEEIKTMLEIEIGQAGEDANFITAGPAESSLPELLPLSYEPNVGAYHESKTLSLGTRGTGNFFYWAQFTLHAHAIGSKFRGLIGFIPIFSYFGSSKMTSSEPFQTSYAESYESAERRFRPWLEESLVNALTLWRKSL